YNSVVRRHFVGRIVAHRRVCQRVSAIERSAVGGNSLFGKTRRGYACDVRRERAQFVRPVVVIESLADNMVRVAPLVNRVGGVVGVDGVLWIWTTYSDNRHDGVSVLIGVIIVSLPILSAEGPGCVVPRLIEQVPLSVEISRNLIPRLGAGRIEIRLA